MSPDGVSVRQISVGRWCLKLFYIFLFTVVISALGGMGYGFFYKTSHEAIEHKNASLKAKVKSLESELESEQKSMEEIKRMADKVSSGLGIDAETDGVAEQQGGSGFGVNSPEYPDSSEFFAETDSTPHAVFSPSENPDSLRARVAEARAAIIPVYDYVRKDEQKLNETPSILPIIAPDNGEGKVFWYSSGYGRRLHPTTRRLEFHAGLDIATKKGTPIIAAAHGVISDFGYNKLLGNMVRIKHPAAKMETVYGHMSKFADDMRVGKRVARGEVIGYVGTSGRSTGYHLHYGVKDYDVWQSSAGSWENPENSIFGHWKN